MDRAIMNARMVLLLYHRYDEHSLLKLKRKLRLTRKQTASNSSEDEFNEKFRDSQHGLCVCVCNYVNNSNVELGYIFYIYKGYMCGISWISCHNVRTNIVIIVT